ncbi:MULTISPECIES: DUF6021 family protein [unclassified Pseudomonas]|uniref:DUF6021 family protein n=1 Tax=unclassified Pseudomonas TaxID=196821 RepID=UPI000DAA308C|nr:DUF6021 family protein [Pseudomonas sp. 2023EL-01195]MDW3716144.1 DUF6021 family protein [Pseudomonas sp. 2023EL-01195]PZE11097.1 hypothetical protein DMX10_22560 [Pseudomonas sp. 57B-090624]
MTQQDETDPTNRLRRDSPGDARGLPGYPKERDGERLRRQMGDELGFDPDSPDLADPQIDPPGPPQAPTDGAHPARPRAPGKQYPPYD